MRLAGTYIAGTGRRLPRRLGLDEAAAAGLCERAKLWRTRIASVCVADDESGPQLAAVASRRALRQAGVAGAEIDLLLYASLYYPGHDLWTPASYVQREAAVGSGPAIEVAQMSNGGLAAIELAAAYLRADADHRHALVTTGDRFVAPGIDRWASDPGTVLGDGGTALVLSSRDGFARLRAIASVSDPELEAMQRGDEPFRDAPYSSGRPVDVDAHRKVFVAGFGLDAVMERFAVGQQAVLERALDDAGVDFADLDWFVLPNLGRPRLDEQFLNRFSVPAERTTWEWGRRVGHLGAGDQIAGLGRLVDSRALEPGQLCLLVGVGAGFTWSCAVVEMLRPAPVPAAEDIADDTADDCPDVAVAVGPVPAH